SPPDALPISTSRPTGIRATGSILSCARKTDRQWRLKGKRPRNTTRGLFLYQRPQLWPPYSISRTKGLGSRFVQLAVADSDAVNVARRLLRHITVQHVLKHQLGIAPFRGAVTAATLVR